MAPTEALAKKNVPAWIVVVAVAAVALLAVAAALAFVGFAGVRKYVAAAKGSEAESTLLEIAADAKAVYDDRGKVCPTATRPVPGSLLAIRGQRYQSTPAEWAFDRKSDSGFSCLGFHLDAPQTYQYLYEARTSDFVATAHGDLDGDGTVSTFQITGKVKGNSIDVGKVTSTNPTE